MNEKILADLAGRRITGHASSTVGDGRFLYLTLTLDDGSTLLMAAPRDDQGELPFGVTRERKI